MVSKYSARVWVTWRNMCLSRDRNTTATVCTDLCEHVGSYLLLQPKFTDIWFTFFCQCSVFTDILSSSQSTVWWRCLQSAVRCCGGKSWRSLSCTSSVVFSTAASGPLCVSSSANPSSWQSMAPQVRAGGPQEPPLLLHQRHQLMLLILFIC